MGTTIGGVAVNPGQLLTLEAGDYLFGSGTVTAVIREVLGSMDYRAECWVEMQVDQLIPDWDPIRRTMTVRLDAIRTSAARAGVAR